MLWVALTCCSSERRLRWGSENLAGPAFFPQQCVILSNDDLHSADMTVMKVMKVWWEETPHQINSRFTYFSSPALSWTSWPFCPHFLKTLRLGREKTRRKRWSNSLGGITTRGKGKLYDWLECVCFFGVLVKYIPYSPVKMRLMSSGQYLWLTAQEQNGVRICGCCWLL